MNSMFDRATEKNSQGPCPFRAEGICTGDDCVMWNDDVNACGLDLRRRNRLYHKSLFFEHLKYCFVG